MLRFFTISSVSYSKRLALSFLLFTGLTTFSFASMRDGDSGGGKLKGASSWRSSFAPVKVKSGFTLKAGPNYHASTIFNEERKQPNYLQLNSFVTYQKGNVTYVVPYSHRVTVSAGKSSLQAVNLKVNFHH